MSRNATHTFDGLVVGYGTHSTDNDVMAVTGDSGTIRTYVIEMPDAELLEDTDIVTTASLPQQSVVIPRGSYITSAVFSVTVGFTSGGSATLDIGTYEAGGDGSSTGDDVADGIDADIALSAMNEIGDVVTCNGVLVAGALPVGKVSDSDVIVVFGFEEAVFTAGAGVLTLVVVVPHGAQGVSLAA